MTEATGPRPLGHGIHVVPVPLPFPKPPTVNVYAVGVDDITLIDCGADWDVGRATLLDGLDRLGLSPEGVRRLVITHLHPDHAGAASRFARERGWPVVMHARALVEIPRYNDTASFGARQRRLCVHHGVPPEDLEAVSAVGPRPDFMPPLDLPDITVEDGDLLSVDEGRSLEVLYTPGHQPTHICLRDTRSGILFSGDHVLPRITPAVPYDEEVEDALGDFLSSLRRIVAVDAGLTYPAHGPVVEQGGRRAEQIILHHQRRLEEMRSRTNRPATAWEVMRGVFRPDLSPLESRMALSETVSHLEYLRLRRRLETSIEDGVIRYRAD